VVTNVDVRNYIVFTEGGRKATLNAPLLLRVMNYYNAKAVVHLHEETRGWSYLPYSPPGTVADNNREFSSSYFNIEGHGCIFVED
jgi:hypothetical protein